MKEEKITRIKNSMDKQIEEKGFATVVDTFIDIGILEKLHYEKWRKGQVLYLEKVCKVNLNKLSEIIKEIYKYSEDLKSTLEFGTGIGIASPQIGVNKREKWISNSREY